VGAVEHSGYIELWACRAVDCEGLRGAVMLWCGSLCCGQYRCGAVAAEIADDAAVVLLHPHY
jgi:hypothetical protein